MASVEEELLAQCEKWAFTVYYRMHLSQDWGDAGEQQVKTAFCRVLLQLPPQQELSYDDVSVFYEKIEAGFQKFGLTSLSLQAVQTQLNEFSFVVYDRMWPGHDLEALSHQLLQSGSPYFFQGGYYGEAIEFILGTGTTWQRGDYTVVYFDHEYMRTPNTIMAMAAMIGHRTVYVRKEALVAIFYQKWVALFDLAPVFVEPLYRYGALIKQWVLALYAAESRSAFVAMQATFIEDMKETVLCHELGHGVIQHHLLPMPLATLGEALTLCGPSIVIDLLEFLADFAPAYQGLWGPVYNMILLAKTDLQRAKKLYTMYVSDTWFYDTQDTYMYGYSDLVSLVLVTFYCDGEIDFLGLDKAITEVLLPKALSAMQAICQGAIELIPELNCLDNDLYSYTDFVKQWSEILEALKEQPERWAQLLAYLEQAKLAFTQTWLETLVGQGTDGDIRAYLSRVVA